MRRPLVLVAALLVLSACGESQPELVDTDVSTLRVTGERKQGDGYAAYLSPDGRTLLYGDGDEGTCVRAVDGTNEHCLGLGMQMEKGEASWSPDGRRLALTETHALGLESDIWVLDVESGDLVNLTDDGVDAGGVNVDQINGDAEPADGATMDGHPSWTPDGERIRFVRRESADTVTLMSVSADGGDAEPLRSLDTSFDRMWTVAWADDKIAWLVGPADGESGGSVLVTDLADGEPRKLLDGGYLSLSWAADGDFLLADEPGEERPAVGAARVVPAHGGEPVAVASGDVVDPTWAPEGHAIAYLDGAGTLRVVGKPGGKPRDLYTVNGLGAANPDRLNWVPGSILAMVDETPLLLEVSG